MLPCHLHCDFKDPNWKSKDTLVETPQCAGAAIFRANMGLSSAMPKSLHKMPADTSKVFSNPQEFYAHHKGISMAEADYQLQVLPPLVLMRTEMIEVLRGKS